MLIGFVSGMAWVIVGLYVLAWLTDKFPDALQSVVGIMDDSWRARLMGWFSVIIWPITIWSTLTGHYFNQGLDRDDF